MQDVSMYPQELSKHLAPTLTQEEWKKLVLCSNDTKSYALFNAMRATIEDPAFLYAFFPKSMNYQPCRDLFELSQSKPEFLDKALAAYYQSPHYQENGMQGFLLFTVGSMYEEAKKEFLRLIVERATPDQLINLSHFIWPENLQSELLNERIQCLSLPTLLDVYYKALQGEQLYHNHIAIDAKKHVIRLKEENDWEIHEIFPDMTMEQCVAFFYISSENEFDAKNIVAYFKEDLIKLDEFLREVARTINVERVNEIKLFLHGISMEQLLSFYTNVDLAIKRTFVADLHDIFMRVFFAVSRYDLAGEMLTFLKPEQINELASEDYNDPDLLEMFKHYTLFKELLLSVFEKMTRECSRQVFQELAAAIVTNVPKEDLPLFLKKLDNPYFRFHIVLLAAGNVEEEIIQAINEVMEVKFLEEQMVINFISFIGIQNNNLEQILRVLAKATQNNRKLKYLFISCMRWRDTILPVQDNGNALSINWNAILVKSASYTAGRSSCRAHSAGR